MNATTDSIRAACTAQATVATPLGNVLIARTERGLAGLWFDGQKHHPGRLDAPERGDDPILKATSRWLQAYFAGNLKRLDVPLDLRGTPFQQGVWKALLEIPAGSTCSYAQIAVVIGAAGAVRAVGGAIGRNPVSVIVPCHRVVGGSGSLTGYAGGMARKRSLLELEGAVRPERGEASGTSNTAGPRPAEGDPTTDARRRDPATPAKAPRVHPDDALAAGRASARIDERQDRLGHPAPGDDVDPDGNASTAGEEDPGASLGELRDA